MFISCTILFLLFCLLTKPTTIFSSTEVICAEVTSKWQLSYYNEDGMMTMKRGITTDQGLFQMDDPLFSTIDYAVEYGSIELHRKYSFTASSALLSRYRYVISSVTICTQ
jgi:hypothetical protein